MRNKIEAFTKSAIEYLGEDAVNSIYGIDVDIIADDLSTTEEGVVIEDESSIPLTRADPEGQRLPFPSAVGALHLMELSLEQRAKIQGLQQNELQLRPGHANDALDQVRNALIQLSWQYKNKVRSADSQYTSTRAYDTVHILNPIWKLHRRIYNHNRAVMMTIGDEAQIGAQFPLLLQSECFVSTMITDPNTAGQSSRRLPWFWSSSSTSGAGDTHHDECNFALSLNERHLIHIFASLSG